MQLYVSDKFHHATEQYRLDAYGFTLLRLSYGTSGGALKSATAGDDFGPPAYPDHLGLARALALAWQKLGLRIEVLELREDRKRRPFVQAAGTASRDEFFFAMQKLAVEMASTVCIASKKH